MRNQDPNAGAPTEVVPPREVMPPVHADNNKYQLALREPKQRWQLEGSERAQRVQRLMDNLKVDNKCNHER